MSKLGPVDKTLLQRLATKLEHTKCTILRGFVGGPSSRNLPEWGVKQG